MSELRREPIYGRSVLIAPDRLQRPNAIVCNPWKNDPRAADCPFCQGREHLTPPAVLTLPDAEDRPWWVRVVPNRFPALQCPASPAVRTSATGVHEIVIESPEHISSILQLDRHRRELVFLAYQQRMVALRQRGDLHWGIVFKNYGPEAGASQFHVHSQIMGFQDISPAMAHALRYATTYWQQHSHCVFCALAGQELSDVERVVLQTENFMAFCPAASRFAYETWVLPRAHASHFDQCTPTLVAEFAQAVASILASLEGILDEISYNFTIYNAPFDSMLLDHYHWHMMICPRVARIAGCEMFADIYVNPVDPLEAARQVRAGLTKA